MKQSKQSKNVVAKAKEAVGTYSSLKTLEEITNNYAAQKANNKNTENDFSNLLIVAKNLISNFDNGRSFSVQDFAVMAAHLNLKYSTIAEFYEGWVNALKDDKRILTTEGCYTYAVHSFI